MKRAITLALLLCLLAAGAIAADGWWLASSGGVSTVAPSATGPASIAISNAVAVDALTDEQFNIVGHGLVTGDGPYEISSTGTVALAGSGWLYGEAVYAIRIDDNEFQLSETLGGSAINWTAAGDGNHTLTKLAPSEESEIPVYTGTAGTQLRVQANPCTVATAGTFRCTSIRGSTLFASEGHPNPAIGNLENGVAFGNVPTGSATRVSGNSILRLMSRNLRLSIVGDIGGGTSSANMVRVLRSHVDATRMVSPTTVVVSTPNQDTGTEICGFDALTCVFVEESVAPVDGVAAAWTWQACGDDLTDNNWARAYCSTVTDP